MEKEQVRCSVCLDVVTEWEEFEEPGKVSYICNKCVEGDTV